MTRTDGTACARLSVFPSGFPRRRLPPFPIPENPLPPFLPCCLIHVFVAQHVRRYACSAACARAGVFMCVCVCVRVQFVKWNLNNTRAGEKDPAVGSEVAHDKVFKIYSINRRWIRSSRSPTRMSNFRAASPRQSLRHVCVRRYLRHFTRTRMNWEVKIFYEHLAFKIIIMSAATN